MHRKRCKCVLGISLGLVFKAFADMFAVDYPIRQTPYRSTILEFLYIYFGYHMNHPFMISYVACKKKTSLYVDQEKGQTLTSKVASMQSQTVNYKIKSAKRNGNAGILCRGAGVNFR